MKAAIYVRLSKDTDASTSIERQREACQTACEARGLDVADVYEDIGVSGFTAVTRPERDALLARLDEYDALVVLKLDRLARNTRDAVEIFERCQQTGVVLISVLDHIDLSTPMGKAMAQISSVFAEMESETISARVKSTQEHLARVGRFRGGRRPFGYDIAPNPKGPGKVLVINEREAGYVREIARRMISGETYVSICQWLEAEGVATARGLPHWTVAALRGLMKRDSLMGLVERNGELVRDDDGIPLQPWAEILDPVTHAKVQKRLGDKRAWKRLHSNKNVLRGVIFCDGCRGPMNRIHRLQDGYETSVYRCPSYSSRTVHCDRPSSIGFKTVERFVIGTMLGKFAHWPSITSTVVADHSGSEIEMVKQRIAAVEDQLVSDDEIDPATFGTVLARLNRKLKALEGESARKPEVVRHEGDLFGLKWEQAEVHERAAILRPMCRVFIRPGKRGDERMRLVLLDEWGELVKEDDQPWQAKWTPNGEWPYSEVLRLLDDKTYPAGEVLSWLNSQNDAAIVALMPYTMPREN